MPRTKGLKKQGRRGFLSLGLAILGLPLGAKTAGAAAAEAAAHTGTHPVMQRARLPRRLAADFYKHIDNRLPLLRPHFESAAQETGFGWRVLAALAYQESRWRPAAVSPRGAQGVMMLMPVTARKMGVSDVFAPEENILGGARYLAYIKGRIPKRIRDPDRTWMALAAYNIGIGHLEDARIITQMRRKNPDRWADVRANLPRLEDPHWHTRVKRGYANGSETVQFVERVTQFAAILESHVPESTVVQSSPAAP
ncbi:MAG TPA: transglycosylase SLT domain-containing protein [Steroidobacteraceae bacterium]|nr:transglycosylase SLT domain-containing protein [Steroidobacteraceae bacterium]